jgi:hypothetical protein
MRNAAGSCCLLLSLYSAWLDDVLLGSSRLQTDEQAVHLDEQQALMDNLIQRRRRGCPHSARCAQKLSVDVTASRLGNCSQKRSGLQRSREVEVTPKAVTRIHLSKKWRPVNVWTAVHCRDLMINNDVI